MRFQSFAFLTLVALIGMVQISLPAYCQSFDPITGATPGWRYQYPLLDSLSGGPTKQVLPDLSPIVLEHKVGESSDKPSAKHWAKPLASQPAKQSTKMSATRATNQPAKQSANLLATKPTNLSATQSADLSALQSANQSSDQLSAPSAAILTSMLPAPPVLDTIAPPVPQEAAAPETKVGQTADTPEQPPQLRGDSDTTPVPQAVSTPPLSSAGKKSVLGTIFSDATQTLERNFSMPGYNPPITAPIPRRAPPPGLDPVFPSTEFIGTNAQAPMGVNDNNGAQYPLEQILWRECPILAKYRIRVYGWLNPSYNYGTSHHSNYPMSYIVAARSLHWDQIVTRFERVPDTVQQKHMDWGFRFTSLYGEDYRFTLSKGWVSNQLLKYNYLTGWDPCECFGLLYVPKIFGKKIFDGVSIRVGRYISCPDIEAQLAPDNYLFTHSLMFTVDTYTQTGIQTWFQLNKYWNAMIGFHGGADTAPWTNSTVPTGQFLVRWVSKTNKNSVYAGINDINGLPFRHGQEGFRGKDNLQQVNINFTHVFNRRCHTVTEWYYLWTRNADEGGTVSNGPTRPYGGGGGPGAFLQGYSQAIGLVNYTLFKLTDRDYITLRPLDLLADPRGWRTGYPTEYMSGTIGWCHRFSDTLCVRPEFRIERSLRGNVTPYDDGKRVGQATFACDLIQRY